MSSGPTYYNVIDYVTIASAGNATDFGDLIQVRNNLASCSSTTIGVFAGGATNLARFNIIDYVTIASAGNATDFGDLASTTNRLAGCSSATRGVFGGGSTGGLINVLQYITIASAGNSTDFGDLTASKSSLGAASSSTSGVFAGGTTNGSNSGATNVIEYITIASTGNAVDYGDLAASINEWSGCSNAHGGL